MGTRTTKKLFEQVSSGEIAKFFAPLGFVESRSGAYTRCFGKVVHGFGLTANPSYTHFHVPVGAYIPALEERLAYGRGAHCAGLLVSRWLGELKENFNRNDCYYHFATVEQLREVLPRVHADFVEQAEPWLETLATVEDVAREFHKWRIAPPSRGENRPPDPFAWALYGWLLQEAGKPLEAQPWLERALDQLKEPAFYTKGGHFVPIGTPGARAVPRTPEEIRLAEMLRKDLRME